MLITFEDIANIDDFEHTAQIASIRLHYPGFLAAVQGLSVLRNLFGHDPKEEGVVAREQVKVRCRITPDRHSVEWFFHKTIPLSDTHGPTLDKTCWSEYSLTISIVNELTPSPYIFWHPNRTSMSRDEFLEVSNAMLEGYPKAQWPAIIGQSMKLFSEIYPATEQSNAMHIAAVGTAPRLDVSIMRHRDFRERMFLVQAGLGNGFRFTAHGELNEPC